MHSLKLTALRAYAFFLAGLSTLDRGVDGVIGQFTKLDAKLDRFIARQQTIADVTLDQIDASYDRQAAVLDAEAAIRRVIATRRRDILSATERAERVKARISALLD